MTSPSCKPLNKSLVDYSFTESCLSFEDSFDLGYPPLVDYPLSDHDSSMIDIPEGAKRRQIPQMHKVKRRTMDDKDISNLLRKSVQLCRRSLRKVDMDTEIFRRFSPRRLTIKSVSTSRSRTCSVPRKPKQCAKEQHSTFFRSCLTQKLSFDMML